MQLDEAFAELGIVQDFIPVGNSNRPGTKLAPTRITIHNTDNKSPGANAAAHAKYQKGKDAQKRKVSWHYTVDDKAVFQSLPTNEVGWHTGTSNGNRSSIGVEICMHPEMDEKKGYSKAALLTAVLAHQHGISVASGIVQHNHWSGKDCPIVLRHPSSRWDTFLTQVKKFRKELKAVKAKAIRFAHADSG